MSEEKKRLSLKDLEKARHFLIGMSPLLDLVDIEIVKEFRVVIDEAVLLHAEIDVLRLDLAAKDREIARLRWGLGVDAIEWFARMNGAQEVHRAWRDRMLEQSRTVTTERMIWDGLDEQDRDLDRLISLDVLRDYSTWVLGEKK